MLELITDRTKEDVDRWAYLKSKSWADMTSKERTEWNTQMKGRYGHDDLNRVGEAVKYISGRFEKAGYIITLKPIKTDWTIQDNPNLEQLTDYLDNVFTLKDIISTFPGMPDVPADMNGLTYQEANNIERILVDIETALELMKQSFRYSNQYMFYAGNDPIPIDVSEYILRTSDGKIIRSQDGYVFIVR